MKVGIYQFDDGSDFTPFENGVESAGDGLKREDNPYNKNTPEFKMWNDGYMLEGNNLVYAVKTINSKKMYIL